ncbi:MULTISPECIES: hypothetical protein [unclassified Streptomyces]|uniref:hypothetical protein n=1 Tax=unclassified Streptomyces TaxID=2593676 RepID=UPI003828C0A8
MKTDLKLPTMLLGVLSVLLITRGGMPLVRTVLDRLALNIYLPYWTLNVLLVLLGAGLAMLAVRRARYGR